MPHIKNNFEFLRIFAALAVLISHHFPLSNLGEPSIPGVISLGGVAVMIFFSISGFLVTQSWLSDRNAFRFLLRRFLRIWPALTMVVFLSVFVLGPILSSLSISEYFLHKATWDYLKNILMKIHFLLPGVFTDKPGGAAVNGSLWTIPFEVRCYIALGILGALTLLRSRRWVFAWGFIFFIWYISKGIPDIVGTYTPGHEFSAYFVVGCMLYCCKKWWLPHSITAMITAFLVGSILFHFGYKFTALLTIIPMVSIGFGMLSTPVLKEFGRYGDPSFGMYLYAFPIQQTIIYFASSSLDFYAGMALSIIITTIFAYSSWFFIEKPALRLKPSKRATQ